MCWQWNLTAYGLHHFVCGLTQEGRRVRRAECYLFNALKTVQVTLGFVRIITDLVACAFKVHDVFVAGVGELDDFKRSIRPGVETDTKRDDFYRHVRKLRHI